MSVNRSVIISIMGLTRLKVAGPSGLQEQELGIPLGRLIQSTMPQIQDSPAEEVEVALPPRKRRFKSIANLLVNNAISAIYGMVELHNKPFAPYRYQTGLILLAHSWELLLKAQGYKIGHKKIKKYLSASAKGENPAEMVHFQDCVAWLCVGDKNACLKEHLLLLNEERNRIMHANLKGLEPLWYSIFQKSVILFDEFLREHFQQCLPSEEVVILPIGLRKPFSAIDFLREQPKTRTDSDPLIKGVIDATKRLSALGVTDSILVNYEISIMGIGKVKNQDLIVEVDKENARTSITTERKIRIDPNATAYANMTPEQLRSIFTHAAQPLRTRLKVNRWHPEREKAYGDITQDKWYQKYWWIDARTGKKMFSEEGIQTLEAEIEKREDGRTRE